jgi:hypothetical protein
MNEISLILQSLLQETNTEKLKAKSKNLLNALNDKSFHLSEAKFSTLLTNFTLRQINQKIEELEKSMVGLTGRGKSKIKPLVYELNQVITKVYKDYPMFLKDDESFINFKDAVKKKNNGSRNYILINEEYEKTLESVLYPLTISNSKLETSISLIKSFINSNFNDPQNFEYGKYHLSEYYRNLNQTLDHIQQSINISLIRKGELEEQFVRTSIFDTYYNEEINENLSIKDEINDSLVTIEIELESLNYHKDKIIDLIDYLEFSYPKLLNAEQKNNDNKSQDFNNVPNPYPAVFISMNAYNVFENFINGITIKTQLADCSFIYRIMQQEGFINQALRESDYRRWLNEVFEIAIDKTKGLENCTTPHKEKIYSLLKEKFQL